jgi:hypothetical protein
MARPSDFPPPYDPGYFVATPTDPVDERIEVGVVVVGAGPAGLRDPVRRSKSTRTLLSGWATSPAALDRAAAGRTSSGR